MKRRVLMLALFLILGAIVNVAVAWGLRAISFPEFEGDNLVARSAAVTMAGRFQAVDETWVHTSLLLSRRWASPGVAVTALRRTASASHTVSMQNQRDLDWAFWDVQSGWPMKATIGQAWVGEGVTFGLVDIATGGGRTLPVGSSVGNPSMPPTIAFGKSSLPFAPLWPGFAINTVFYAALLWMLFAGSFALRRRMRIKRGLCPKCAYPVGTNEVCTECGAAIVKQKAETQKAETA